MNADSLDGQPSPYYSLPPAFMPPESPNTTREIAPQETKNTRYTGVKLALGQLENLTFCSGLGSDPTLANNSDQILSSTMTSADRTSIASWQNEGTQRRLPFRERPDIGRVPTSFLDLALQSGVAPRNNRAFDNRWLLWPEEVWNVDTRPKSVLTMSPLDVNSARKVAGTIEVSPEIGYASSFEPAQSFVSAEYARKTSPKKNLVLKGSSYPIPLLNNIGPWSRFARGRLREPGDILAAYAAIMGISEPPGHDRLPFVPEVRRLRETFQELIGPDRKLSSVSSFPVDVVRRFLHDRVFGEPEGCKADAEVLTEFGGNVISRGELRKELVKVIESMVEEITDTQLHHVPVGESLKLFVPQTEPLTPHHPFFIQIQREIRRVQQRLHSKLVEFESKMTNEPANSDQEEPQFWFDQNPIAPLHTYPQGTSGSSHLQSAPQGSHLVSVIGQGRQSSVNSTNTINQGRQSYLNPTNTINQGHRAPSGVMDQVKPSSSYLKAEDNFFYAADTIEQAHQSSINLTRTINQGHLASTHPSAMMNPNQPSSTYLQAEDNSFSGVGTMEQGHQSSVNPINQGRLASTYPSAITNQTQSSSTYLQPQDNSFSGTDIVDQGRHFPTYPVDAISQAHLRLGYSTENISQGQQALSYQTNTMGQVQQSLGYAPSNMNQMNQGYIGQDQQTLTYPQNLHYPPTLPFPGHGVVQYPQQQQPLYQMVPDPHGQLRLVQVIAPQAPNPYQQSAQFAPQVTPPIYSQGFAPSFSQPAIAYPGYSQAPGYNTFLPPVPVPLPGMRPAAHQRLAPLALRSGALKEIERGIEPTSHSTPAAIPIQSSRQHAIISAANAVNTEWYNQLGRQPAPGPILSTRPSLPFGPGAQTMYPPTNGGTSQEMQHMICNGRPSVAKATDRALVPFAENAKEALPVEWGVIKIGNIPYSLTRNEVRSFVGRSAKIAAVHINMERSTGKTMDCYVEFFSFADAQETVNKLNSRGRPLKLGNPPLDRIVTVEISSQEALMKDLFPRAKNVYWPNGKPVIYESDEPFNTGFKGFITGEELVMMCKHAEHPHRSSFTQKCPQRVYECMISILAKFPWHAVDKYTIATRNQIFNATRDQLRHLMTALNRGGQPKLTTDLLWEVMIAGLNAPGFTEKQRHELTKIVDCHGPDVGLSPLAEWWPWEVLGRKANMPEDLIEFYAHCITLHPGTINTPSVAVPGTYTPFGQLTFPKFSDLTMAVTGEHEWEQLKLILEDVLGHA